MRVKSLLLLLVMTAPGLLSPLGEAQPSPTDALGRSVDDALHGANQTQEQAQPVLPKDGGLPDVGAAQGAANGTAGEAQGEVDQVQRTGPIRTLFYDGFEDPKGLAAQGWTGESLLGDAPWGLADARTGAVQRLDGSSFTPANENGAVPVPVKDGRHAATVLNPKGVYDSQVDARLVSPVIDLRGVEGASVRATDPYDLITKDPTLSAPYKNALALWLSTLAPIGQGTVGFSGGLGSYTYLLVTEPTHLKRLYVNGPGLSSLQTNIDQVVYNPLSSRYGAALVNLTFYQRYELNGATTKVPPGYGPVRSDGAFLEVRVLGPGGRAGPWEHLDGDTIFEAQVDKNTALPVPCPLNLAFGILGSAGGQGIRFDEGGSCPLSSQRVPVSGVVEVTEGEVAQHQEYDPISSYYQGRVQVRARQECEAVGVVDCQPDVPAFVASSRHGGLIKSHFTLNRYAGEQIQVAFRLRSAVGPNAGDSSQVGWFLDGVKVEALVPARDPAIASADQPRPLDVVPTSQLVQPTATIVNNGFLPVEGVQVNFTIEERPRDVLGDVQNGSDADTMQAQQAACAGAVDTGSADPGVGSGVPPPVNPRVTPPSAHPCSELPPTNTVGAAERDVQPAKVLMTSSLVVPRLEAGQRLAVTSPQACLRCGPGAYQLRIELSLQTLGGGDLATAPERTEDGSTQNDAATVPFDVRDVVQAKVQLSMDAGQVLTDLNEPKTFHLLATNLGNRPIRGSIELNATQVDPTTLRPLGGQVGFPVGALFLGEGGLPAGTLLTSYGSARDTMSGNVTWDPRGLPPGVFRITAVLRGDPAPSILPTAALNSYIRTTPTAYVKTGFEDPGTLPRDGFGADHVERAGLAHQGWVQSLKDAAFYYPLPKGAVSTNHTWEGTGEDGGLADLGALAVLSGAVVGVTSNGANTATVRAGQEGVLVCEQNAACTPVSYSALEDAIRLANPTLDHHAYLDDYYLTTTLDLTACKGCQPKLSFQQVGNFSWGGTLEQVDLPAATSGTLPSSVAAPPVVQHVSPQDQVAENRSRGLVEVSILDDDLPAGVGTGMSLRPPADTRGLADLACSVELACATLLDACPGDVFGPDGSPLHALDATIGGVPVTPLATFLGQQVAYNPRCVVPFLQQPSGVSTIVADFRTPVKEFQRVQDIDLAPFVGHRVALTFHFQTTIGRLQGQTDPIAPAPEKCGGVTGNSLQSAGICLGHSLDRWVVDNIVLRGAGASDFFDTVGDAVPGIPQNANWTRWASFRTMREAADADATLDPACAQRVQPVDTKNPQAFASGLDAASLLPGCINAGGTQLHGLVVTLDGRGWERHAYNFTPSLEGPTSPPPATPTVLGPDNPYPDGWFLDSVAGFNAPGHTDLTHRYALRWGGPKASIYPTENLYAVASTPAFDLTATAGPFLDFQTWYDFDRQRSNSQDDKDPTAFDGGSIFLARYTCPKGADCAAHPEQLVFDRRGQVVPVGGYPGKVKVTDVAQSAGMDWGATIPGDALSGSPLNPNAFSRQSGGSADPTWVRVGADLATAFPAMCLKRITTADGTQSIASYQVRGLGATCPDTLAQQKPADWVRVDAHTLRSNATGDVYADVDGFTQDPDGRYAVEFHALNHHDSGFVSEGLGWSIDDLRIGEQFLANDVGVSRFVVPGAGRIVGPGEEIQVRVNVTNYGLFTQHGVRVHFNVTQQGVQVFPDPALGDSAVQTINGGVAGLRDPTPLKNVTVAFDTAWVPRSEGVFVINAWTEITGEVVNGLLIPLTDEDASNDQFTQQVEVREVHSMRILRADEMPDGQVVQPLVGTPGDARAIRLGIENTGTVSEGLALGDDRAVVLHLVITDEAGIEVLRRDLTVDRITAGSQAIGEFGLQAWKPAQSGLYTLRFNLEMARDLTPGDNDRVVKVLVLTQLIPQPGQTWQDLFRATGTGWANGTRLSFDAGQGWSFGAGQQYGPDQDGTIVLKVPVDLTTFRSAVLAVKHSYDFEQGYDGGLVEVSPDGRTWIPVEPLSGYPGALTTASPAITDPDQHQDAFTGRSQGVVDSFFPLGTVNITRTDLITLLRDTFEPDAPTVLGQRVNSTLGQWYETRTSIAVPTGKAWYTNRTLVNEGRLTRQIVDPTTSNAGGDETGLALPPSDTYGYEGTKTLRTGVPFVMPAINGSLLVEYQEWRSLGVAHRGGVQDIHVPSGAEADLERLDGLGTVAEQLVVVPRGATALAPYADNQMGWTGRTVVLPAPTVEGLKNQPLRLAFKVSLASGNNQAAVHVADSPGAFGGGSPEDTDLQGPGLGWAVASPRVSLITSAEECSKAIAAAKQAAIAQPQRVIPRYESGRCILFDDAGLQPGPQAYASTDAALARWDGAWSTKLSREVGSREALRTASSDDSPDLAAAALRDGGWRIVDKVGLLTDSPVWDTRSSAPPASGHGLVALAQGDGQEARLITPLDLRAASGELSLRLNQSFKFTQVELREGEPFTGGYAGGRVEVSRDGGLTWEPVAPDVPAPDPLTYTSGLRAVHFNRTFTYGQPISAMLCTRPASPGCIQPSDPFSAPGHWTPQDDANFTIDPANSVPTPFAGSARDPEGDSPYGFSSLAFSGTTCTRQGFEEKLDDPCLGPEDWQGVRFDLSPYAGQDVLLAFHAWFPTHRFVGAPHIGSDGGGNALLVPRDFWRVDDVAVEGRVLDGRPLFVRLHGFSDRSGERYGWDVLNVSLLGDQHLANLGVRIIDPGTGAPLFGKNATVSAVVQNKGLTPFVASGLLLAEPLGLPELRNGAFEQVQFDANTPAVVTGLPGWTIGQAASATNGWSPDYAKPAEGSSSFKFTGVGTDASALTLRQDVVIPAGSWSLSGRYLVAKNANELIGGVEARLLDAKTGLPFDNDAKLGSVPLGGSSRVQLEFPTRIQADVVRSASLAGSGPNELPLTVSAPNITRAQVTVNVSVTSPLHPSNDTVNVTVVAPGGLAVWNSGWFNPGATAVPVGQVCVPRVVVCVQNRDLSFAFDLAAGGPFGFAVCPTLDVTTPRASADAAWADMPADCTRATGTWRVFVNLTANGAVQDSSTYNVDIRLTPTAYAARLISNGWSRFALNVTHEGAPTAATLEFRAQGGQPFTGIFELDDLRFEPRPPDGAVPAMGALLGGDFESGLGPWKLANATWRSVANPRDLKLTTAAIADCGDADCTVTTRVVPSGSAELGIEGTGFGEQVLSQDVALQPGAYRFSGMIATRSSARNLTIDADGGDGVVLASNATVAGEVRQTVQTSDLPRWLRGVRVFCAAACVGPFAVRMLGPDGSVLQVFDQAGTNDGQARSLDLLAKAPHPLVAVVPYGIKEVTFAVVLNTTGETSEQLQARPDAEYPRGTLRDAALSDLGKDLRMDLLADVATKGVAADGSTNGNASIAVAGGPRYSDDLAHLATVAPADITVPASFAHTLRQVVNLSGVQRGRLTGVDVRVQFPGGVLMSSSAGGVNCYFTSLREGQLVVQLFDMQGRPLGPEAAFWESARSPAGKPAAVDCGTTALPSLDPVERVVHVELPGLAIPAGATQVQVGLRAVNFTGERALRVRAVQADSAADKLSFLTLNGTSTLRFIGPGCAAQQANATTWHACSIAMGLGVALDGYVAIDAVGAQGAPLKVVDPFGRGPTLSGAHAGNDFLHGVNGSVPFVYDFVMPPGKASTQLRVRLVDFQGEVLLDDLRLQALTQPATVFSGMSLSPGESRNVTGADGAQPQFVTLKGASYRITAQALPFDGQGRLVRERVVGDDVSVVRTGGALGAGRIVVSKLLADPNNYNLSTAAGTPMDLLVTLRNEGADDADIQGVTGTLADLAGHALFQGTQADFDPAPDTLTLGPLQEQTFRWPFLPEATTAAGVYDFGVTVTTQGSRIAPSSDHVLVYIGSDFHRQFGFYWPVSNSSLVDDADQMWPCGQNCAPKDPSMLHWSSAAVYNRQYPPTNPCQSSLQTPECRSPPTPATMHDNGWFFQKTSAENLSAFRSFHLSQDCGDNAGGDGGSSGCGWFRDGTTMEPQEGTLFAAMRSPAIPITFMQRPQLIYAERRQFNAPDADASIFARLVHCTPDPQIADVPCRDDSPVFPTGHCEDAYNVHGWQLVDAHIQGNNPATPGFNANKWVMRSVDLGPLLDRAKAEGDQSLDYWDHVQVCWHLEQPSPRGGAALIRDWAVDDVFVTPYGTALGPAQEAPIGDNVTKDFHLAIVNRGAYTDTYQVGLQDETGLPSKGPSNWRVELLDEQGRPLREVRAQPGERRVLTVRVHIDVAQPNLPREGQVDIAVTAISKTTAFLRGTQHLVFQFLYPDRPNLRVAGVIINDATLAVDKPRTVDVIVQNTGPVAAVGARLAVLDKVDASLGVAPVALKRVDGTDIPPFDLAPGDLRVVTVNWVPDLDGEHNITAIADPLDELLEFDEKDNVFVKPVVVPKAEFPDLLVEASASKLNPTPGDVVDIQARITNKGGTDAQGVQVTMRAGVTDLLTGEPPHILPDSIPPGGTITLSVSFRAAFPGQQFIFVRAVPRAGVLERLETIDDNTAVLTVSVRSRGLDVVAPAGLTLKPGTTLNTTLTLLNRGDVDDGYTVQLVPPDNWRAAFEGAGEVVHVGIANHSQVNLSLSLSAPSFAEAGPVVIVLRGASENTTEVLESGLLVDVPQDFGLRFHLDDALLPPGDQFLPVRLENKGNGIDVVTVRATSLPGGWLLEPATFRVGPKGSVTVRLNLSIPTTTPEAAYPIRLEAQGRGGDVIPAQAQVQVLPLELLTMQVQGLPDRALPGSELQGMLIVRNAGNLPAYATLRLGAPVDWRVHLQRDIASMQPGEQRILPVTIDVPQNATSGEHDLRTVASSGRGVDYALRQVVQAARADLQVVDFDLQPRGALREGNVATLGVTVRNNGNAPAPAAVAVYLDNVLVGFDAGRDLQPGEEGTANVSFKVQHGEHVVLAAVDPGKSVGEEDEDNNAVVRVLHVEGGQAFFAVPGLEPLLAVAAVLMVAALRRRGPR